jgi:hypothetical protein
MDKTNAHGRVGHPGFRHSGADRRVVRRDHGSAGVAEITALAMAACIEMPVSLVAPAALPGKPRCDQPAVRSAARWRSSFLSTLLT